MGNIITKSKNGFSLVGLLVGIAVLSIVLIASGYLVVQTKTSEVRFDLQSELDRSHLLTLQKTRSVQFIKHHFNLNADTSKNANGPTGPQNVELLRCFSGNGTNCDGLLPANFTELTSARSIANCTKGPGCEIRSTVEYSGACTPTSCSTLEVRFSSGFSNSGNTENFRSRVNLIKLPAVLFANRGVVNFACTANRVLAGVNFDTLQAICPAAAVNNCNNSAPLNQFGPSTNNGTNCPALASTTCATGMASVGMYSGQPGCRPGSNPTPGP